jgi:beta-N-acetylhexosaminidase
LRGLGIDVDLAPVADVSHPGSFLGSRAFSSSPAVVAERACEFAAGLHDEGVAATLKHFPGLGMATASTDQSAVTIDASAARIRRDYAPYRACGSQPLTLVMVDSAVYPKLTGPLPAVMSPLTYSRELPLAGASAVTISDALEAPPIVAQTTPARRSIEAGLDLLLYAKSGSTSAEAFQRLLADARTGALRRRLLSLAAARVLALKEQLAAAS